MRRREAFLRLTTATAVTAAATFTAPLAWAISPPKVSGGPPSSGPVAPAEPTQQSVVCAQPAGNGSDFTMPSKPFTAMEVARAWTFSRGAGQRVAVIDTGVTPQRRLSVVPGGDYVSGGDGTTDCDGHGTAVAGIIAGHPSSRDAFAGVAPAATIIAIRQSSPSYREKDRGDQSVNNKTSSGYGTTATLARAVVRAVELRATVINISQVACMSPGESINGSGELGRAIAYAYRQNVVVVSAAGNVSDKTGCKSQNPAPSTSDPWASVSTVATPAWYSDYSLAVASVESDGSVSDFSLWGPWVAVAAPGSDIVSLSSKPAKAELANGEVAEGKFVAFRGTSYSAAYVSGLAALIRSRYPSLSAGQVMDRIKRTAHGPGARDTSIGYGVIDPVAALADEVPPTSALANPYATNRLPTPTVAPAKSKAPLIATGGALLAGALALLLVFLRTRPTHDRRKLVEGTDF
ncbi:type VII secretion-associated serine protease mycosin [Gordonia sp. X0973]|uniref:type VII secretion-associated serine protease mycosin n=1 Tax=Gordonia sp. X0973 TaxID=2742602 RepID=UPI000F54A2B4|nr:type VII secretion-associated serine protease mycosin [Gordonia sp. X0973]QKT06991.1 type VII secretion-associated serine protease mycosin [Gordonia sp. X0973]